MVSNWQLKIFTDHRSFIINVILFYIISWLSIFEQNTNLPINISPFLGKIFRFVVHRRESESSATEPVPQLVSSVVQVEWRRKSLINSVHCNLGQQLNVGRLNNNNVRCRRVLCRQQLTVSCLKMWGWKVEGWWVMLSWPVILTPGAGGARVMGPRGRGRTRDLLGGGLGLWWLGFRTMLGTYDWRWESWNIDK